MNLLRQVVLGFCLASGLSQISTAAEPAAGPEHFLWKVGIAGSKGEVHLLGSLHLCRPDMYPLPLEIEAAYQSAEAVALEVNLDEKTQQQMAVLFVKHGLNASGVSLSSQLSKDTLRLLDAYQTSNQIPRQAMENMRPWFAAINLTLRELQKVGLDAKLGLDTHFFEKARHDLKPVVGMEQPVDQLSLLSDLDEKTADLMLRQALTDAKDLKADVDACIEAWKKGDTAKIDEILLKDFRSSEFLDLWNKIMVERNEGFADRVEDFLAEGRRVFVVVGAGHLVGPLSVPDLLTKRGYMVKQQ
jgi:uncharacterized protein YbaP (TraB family)